MLNIVIGSRGSGKTEYVMRILKEKIKNFAGELMLIVPEQSSFETEREILKSLGVKTGNKINVMSFTRLVDFALRKTGGTFLRKLNDGGRNIFMGLALQEVYDYLSVYKKASLTQDMVDIMICSLKEFKKCDISIKEVLKSSQLMGNEILKQKITETSLVLSAYEALIQKSYVDPLDDLTRLKEKLLNHNFFKEYTVFIDGFDGFTAQEFSIIELILNQSKECIITICADSSSITNDEMELFYPTKKTMRTLINMAKKNNIDVNPFVELNKTHRFLNEELCFLEKNFLRTYSEHEKINPKNIVVYNAANLYDECNFVANKIKELVINNGYRYKDFVVISRNIKEYSGIIDFIFKKHNIPYFCDNPENIDSKPLITLVLSAFDIINKSYNSQDIFKYLKTGIAGLNTEEISILENYTLLWGINSKEWHEEFTKNPEGFGKKMSEDDKEHLLKVNEIKNKVILPLERFKNRAEKGDGADFAKAVFLLLEDINAFKNLCDTAEKLKESKEIFLAEEQIRIWDLVMNILDQTALVLKDKQLTPKRYCEYLKLAIKSYKLAFIPKSLDEVTIGDIDRMQGQNAKVSFLIGVCEEDFPKTPVPFGIFSNLERKKLFSAGFNMYSTFESLNIEERFLAYRAVTLASEKLFISWPSTDNAQNVKRPSVIVKEIKRIFTNFCVIDEYSIPQIDKVWSKEPAFDMCAKHICDNSLFSQTLKAYFKNNKNYESKIKMLERITKDKPIQFEDKNNAAVFFGNEMNLSASKIESFHICKFKYFCRYILNAKDRKPAQFNFLEYGDLMHYIFENILKNNNKKKLSALNKNHIENEVKLLLQKYINEKLGGIEDKSARFQYLFFRLSKTAQIIVIHIIKEIVQSEFEPSDFELDIGNSKNIKPFSYALSKNVTLNILGKVDRVDIMKKDGKSYVRVIDYKTGKKEFKLSDIIYGLNMQMLIYITAIWKNGIFKYNNSLPAGVLYMPAVVASFSEKKDASNDEINKKRAKMLKMNGIVLNDPKVISGMEKGAKGEFIPVLLKDGKVSKSDFTLSISQMELISEYIKKTVLKMANQLRDGKIEPNPIILNNKDVCSFCEYYSACFHEKDDALKKISKMKKDDVVKILEQGEVSDEQ